MDGGREQRAAWGVWEGFGVMSSFWNEEEDEEAD